MYKLLMLGSIVAVGFAVAKFIKRKKENMQTETQVETNVQPAHSAA